MFVLDLIITFLIGYLLISRLQIIPFIGERTALAILIGAGVKSLALFAFLLFDFQPILAFQIPISLGILFLVFFFFKPRTAQTSKASVALIQDGFSWAKIIAPVLLLVLSALSLKMALNVPIFESDGIWYHIKGMAYFHSVDLNSQAVTVQMRQYPPFVSLIFCYLISGQVETVKLIFPVVFLCLLVAFYYRTVAYTHNGELAAIFTLILGSTPYLWWHSSLPFLDLTVGTFYGLGTIYAFFIVRELKNPNPAPFEEIRSWALLSGSLFGLAGWTRWEYLIYDTAPVLLLFFTLNRLQSLSLIEKRKLFACFSLSLLALPTLWCLTILISGSPDYNKTPEVMAVCVGLWAFCTWAITRNEVRIESKNLVLMCLYAALLFMAFALVRGLDNLFYNGSVALFRLIAGPLFFAFTPALALLIFIKKQTLSFEAKFLGGILIGFAIFHLGVFTYADLKWGAWQEYVRATFFNPGSSINLSDVRGMIAFYPAFVFFIAILPIVKQSFPSQRKVSCP